jgi:hypothetical protein
LVEPVFPHIFPLSTLALYGSLVKSNSCGGSNGPGQLPDPRA